MKVINSHVGSLYTRGLSVKAEVMIPKVKRAPVLGWGGVMRPWFGESSSVWIWQGNLELLSASIPSPRPDTCQPHSYPNPSPVTSFAQGMFLADPR